MSAKRRAKTRTGVVAIVGVCIGVFALYAAQEFLKPIALSILLCFVLAPASQWLERRLHFNRVLSVLTVTLLTAVGMLGVGWVVADQVADLARRLPEYRENIDRKVDSARGFSDRVMGRVMQATRAIRADLDRGSPATAPSTGPSAVAGTESGSRGAPGGGVPDLGIPGTGKVEGDGAKLLGRDAAELLPAGASGASSRPAVIRAEITNLPAQSSAQQSAWQSVLSFFGPILAVLGNAALVAVFVVFMLIQREDLRDRLIALLSHRRIGLTTEALDDAGSRVSRYLLMLCCVNGSYGVLVAVVLWLIGVPAAALWGLLCAVMRFVPYIGPWIAASFPIVLSLAVGDGWSMPAWTIGSFLVIELLSNNVMEPLLYGKGTGVSPVAVMVSAAFWTWLWGAPGLLMATPLTVCVAVTGRHVAALGFLNTLLGDEPALPGKLRYYQRLLAKDEVEAMEVLRGSMANAGIAEAYEEVAIPALKIAERDARRGWLAPQKFRDLLNILRQQVMKLAEQERTADVIREARGQSTSPVDVCSTDAGKPVPLPTTVVGRPNTKAGRRSLKRLFEQRRLKNAAVALRETFNFGTPPAQRLKVTSFALPKGVHPKILILPARDEPDEIAGLMLAKVLTKSGYDVRVLSIALLAHEMVTEVEKSRPDLVIVSATPPSAVSQARYLLKRLNGGKDVVSQPVGGVARLTVLWSTLDRRKLARQLSTEIEVPLATNICDAVDSVRQLTAGVVSQAASGTVTVPAQETAVAIHASGDHAVVNQAVVPAPVVDRQ